jgi:hypothetical protein
MPRIALAEGASVHCIVDDFLWPWVDSTPVLMMHGFAQIGGKMAKMPIWRRWVISAADYLLRHGQAHAHTSAASKRLCDDRPARGRGRHRDQVPRQKETSHKVLAPISPRQQCGYRPGRRY